MDKTLREFLDGLYRRDKAHDRAQADRLRRWRNVEPDTAELMSVLIRALAPRHLLELGTSNGYSTIWLADAARAAGGSLTSVEVDPERSAQARENLSSAGLERFVELRVQDAAEALAASDDQSWEFIFLDAERPAYPGYWPDLRRVLAARGVLVVDNVISHAEDVADFRALITADSTVTEALVPTGAGALLVVRDGPAGSSESPSGPH
jgi:predicted O-methyltransferase YrrM